MRYEVSENNQSARDVVKLLANVYEQLAVKYGVSPSLVASILYQKSREVGVPITELDYKDLDALVQEGLVDFNYRR